MEKIYKKIAYCKSISAKRKVKKIICYYLRKKGAEKAWAKRHQKVISLNDSYRKPCNRIIESEHQKKWSDFRNKIDLSTLRICKNISGKSDARIIPEDIFVSDIEPVLLSDESVHLLSHKSFYNRWFTSGIFPEDIFHRIDGQYLDSNLNLISFNKIVEEVKKISFPVVMKPNKDSYGGKNILFIENARNLIEMCEKSDDYVIQEKILQHKFFKKYNPIGLNTIRVYVYKSVKDNSYHVLNMALRMGKGGSLDNETAGGIHCLVHSDGRLNGYAVDKYGKKYNVHPDTGLNFNSTIPEVKKLINLAINIGKNVFLTRLIGLDACLDKDGKWRAIEINTKGHTTRFAQYGGQPFFGDFTEEVISYCRENHWAVGK